MISAKILADSVSPCGARLTTFELTYPLSIHNELMTHRLCSRNTASSRAIPTEKLIERVDQDPFIPCYLGQNQRGMQAGEELPEQAREVAKYLWIEALNFCIARARTLAERNVHKQVVNRLLNPFMYTTAIFSATSWTNWFGLRDHKDAEPHFQELARAMRTVLPLVDRAVDEPAACAFYNANPASVDYQRRIDAMLVKVSVGRCARVSYLTHDGKRDIGADIALHDRLVVQQPAHASPAEHVAQALDWPKWFADPSHRLYDPTIGPTVYRLQEQVVSARRARHILGGEPSLKEMRAEVALGELTSGNYLGFAQYRKQWAHEHIGGLMP